MDKLGFWNDVVGTESGRPSEWKEDISGEDGHVGNHDAEKQKLKGEGGDKHEDIWLGKGHAEGAEKQEIIDEGTVSDVYVYWGDQVPNTRVVKHVPGYTILDSVILINGSVWLVADDPHDFPTLSSIASAPPTSNESPQDAEWQIVTKEQVRQLGSYGPLIRGVTWLSTDVEPSNHTLLSLWRTYANLDHSIDFRGRTTLPSPCRLIFPNIPYYTQAEALPEERSKTGIDDLAVKAALPSLTLMYHEDWNDFAQMHIPFVLERVVVADRGAAARANGSQPIFSPSYSHTEASKYWFEPVRKMMIEFLQVPEESKSAAAVTDTTPVVTYLSTQEKGTGPRLSDADHQLLVQTLKTLHRAYGYEVNVVPANAGWTERMRILVRSTIIVGVYGTNLIDSYFMKPSPHTMLMEFFPSGYFSRDQELPARSLGTRYIAWWNEQKFVGDALPLTVQPTEEQAREIPINPAAIVKSIKEELGLSNSTDFRRALVKYLR
jgi:hypothetical protein